MGRWVGRSNPNRQWWQESKPSSRGASGGLGCCSSSKGYGMGDVGGLSICLFCVMYGVRDAVSLCYTDMHIEYARYLPTENCVGDTAFSKEEPRLR
jgi:hypothetical protein